MTRLAGMKQGDALHKRHWEWLAALVVAGLLGACASPRNQAPVEDRKPPARVGGAAGKPTVSPSPVAAPQPAPVAEVPPAKPAQPGAENAGKPGFSPSSPGIP